MDLMSFYLFLFREDGILIYVKTAFVFTLYICDRDL